MGLRARREERKEVRFSSLLEDAAFARHVPDWVKECVDPSHFVTLARMPFGTKIGDHISLDSFNAGDAKPRLGLVLSGEAEVLDVSTVENPNQLPIVAHRPIRLLRPADVFGDFELLDRAIARRRPESPSGETFEIVAGRRCLLFAQDVDERHRSRFLPDSVLEAGPRSLKIERNAFEPFHALRSAVDTTTEIVFFDLHALRGDLPIAAWREGWRKVTPYRDGINSYSLPNLLAFRSAMCNAAAVRKRWLKDGKPVYPKAPEFKTLPQILSDALFDALDRPTRGEPMYCRMSDDSEAYGALLDRAKAFGVTAEGLLAASTKLDGTFFYPLDMQNYLLNKYAKQANRPELVKAFPKQSEGTEGLRFYLDLVNDVIQRSFASLPAYPFTVACETMPGPLRPLLILRFVRKVRPAGSS